MGCTPPNMSFPRNISIHLRSSPSKYIQFCTCVVCLDAALLNSQRLIPMVTFRKYFGVPIADEMVKHEKPKSTE